MKELHIDRFDALLSLASAESVRKEAEEFLSADISNIEDNPRMLRRIMGESRRSKWQTVKIIALVALLCMSIAFTACMLVPEIRNALWSVLVRERESSVEIGFETEGDIVTEPTVEGYPKTIEKKMELSYVPNGCIESDEVLTSMQYRIYYTNDVDWKFHITQSTISDVDSFINDNVGQTTYIEICGSQAILIKYYNDDLLYSLTWQDDQYRYIIYGSFSSVNEIIRIAKGIN